MNRQLTPNPYQYTVCPYNCWPVNCGLAIVGGEEGIKELRGNPHHDFSRGRLCVKGQSAREIQDNPHRLASPLKRCGPRGADQWREISWNEALDAIAGKMKDNIAAGCPEANAIYHSHGNIVQRVNWKILTPRFAHLLGMTLWDGNFPCWYDVGVAQELTGYWGLHDPVQMGALSAAVINWAQDPCASQANMTPYLLQVRERGGHIITIDPRVTQTAAISTRHLRPRLGSDVFLANALAHILIEENLYDSDFITRHCHGFQQYREHIREFTPQRAVQECQIPLAHILELAQILAQAKPLCINLTRGALGKHWNGVQMVRAILCLIPLSGNCGVPGGGAVWGEALDWNLNLQAKHRRPSDIYYPPNNINSIITALENKTVNTLLVVGGNPMSQWPDINRLRFLLHNLDLIVVNDLFINHTARAAADIILPAASWLEELGLRTSNSRVYLMDKILEPKAQCREASSWMNDLALRLGVSDYFPWRDKEECLNHCLDSPAFSGYTVRELREHPEGLKGKIPEPPYADHLFPSPSGKFEFFSQKAQELGLPPLPVHCEPLEGEISTPELAKKFPLALISGRRNSHFHSFHDSHRFSPTLQAIEPEPVLWMHPADGEKRGLADGAEAEMFNLRGTARVRIEWTTEVSPGHVSLNDCWPELNMMTPALAPMSPAVTLALNMGGQPAYQNTLVDVRKREDS